MSSNLKNKLVIASLMTLTILAAYLRLYRHHDFLHFELDQARDTLLIRDAVEEGAGELPLLGPRAAGTLLRLGPLFYYFLYFFASIFGDYPDKTALFDAVLSIATVPLLYFFLRRSFSGSISLAVTAVASVSLFAVTYGRFSWNPNTLPFFTLGLLYALTKYFEPGGKKQARYLYLAAVCFGVAVQMHFLAYLALPVVIASFFGFITIEKGIRSIKWRELPWKHIAGSVLTILILNVPVVLNESLTGGDNFKELIGAFTKKSQKGEPRNVAENAFRNAEEYARGYFLIVSGIQEGELMNKAEFKSDLSANIQCVRDCEKAMPYTIAGYIFFITGLTILLSAAFMDWRNRKNPEAENRFRFLLVNILLFLVTFLGFMPFAYQFAPRFLLVTFPVPFVMLALMLRCLVRHVPFGGIAAAVAAAALFITNANANQVRFRELAAASSDNPIFNEYDVVLKEDYRFTLLQQEMITGWIKDQSDKGTVYVWAPPKYYRPLIYLLREYHGLDARLGAYAPPCFNADYFAVVPSKPTEAFFAKGGGAFGSVDVKQFGTFTVHKLEIKEGADVKNETCPAPKSDSEPSYARRYKIKEIFNSQ